MSEVFYAESGEEIEVTGKGVFPIENQFYWAIPVFPPPFYLQQYRRIHIQALGSPGARRTYLLELIVDRSLLPGGSDTKLGTYEKLTGRMEAAPRRELFNKLRFDLRNVELVAQGEGTQRLRLSGQVVGVRVTPPELAAKIKYQEESQELYGKRQAGR